MRIFHYHPTTGALLGMGVADESPLEPGVFAIPAHATSVPPPDVDDGFTASFDINASRWELREIEKLPVVKTPAPDDAETVRAKRAVLLAACDWTQLGDVPEATREKWTAYREALRNITKQKGFPSSVDWPVAPV